MKVERTERGFWIITKQTRDSKPQEKRLVQESSAIGDYENAVDIPGSSFLWFGEDHHLNREEVEELLFHLENWLTTGRLSADGLEMGNE